MKVATAVPAKRIFRRVPGTVCLEITWSKSIETKLSLSDNHDAVLDGHCGGKHLLSKRMITSQSKI
jgi:hypothetical protein